MERFRIVLGLVTETPLYIAGAGRTVPLVDRSVEVDEEGLPFIPASSLRGRARAHLERLAKALGEPICSPPRPDRLCPHNREVAKQLQERGAVEPFCLACRTFGSSWRNSTVDFSDLRVVERQRKLLHRDSFPLRAGVSLSRRLGTAQPEKLFVIETAPANVEDEKLGFEGVIEGLLDRSEIGWLLAALRSITHIGGNKARGLGRIRVDIERLELWDEKSRKWIEEDWKKILTGAMSRG